MGIPARSPKLVCAFPHSMSQHTLRANASNKAIIPGCQTCHPSTIWNPTVVSRNGEMDSPNLAECWECEGYRKTLLQRASPNLLRLGRQCKGTSGAQDLDGRFFLTQTIVWSGLSKKVHFGVHSDSPSTASRASHRLILEYFNDT